MTWLTSTALALPPSSALAALGTPGTPVVGAAPPQDSGDSRFATAHAMRKAALGNTLYAENHAIEAVKTHKGYPVAFGMLDEMIAAWRAIQAEAKSVKDQLWPQGEAWVTIVANQYIDEAEAFVQELNGYKIQVTNDQNVSAPGGGQFGQLGQVPGIYTPAPISPNGKITGPGTFTPINPNILPPSGSPPLGEPPLGEPPIGETPPPDETASQIGLVAAAGLVLYLAYRIFLRGGA